MKVVGMAPWPDAYRDQYRRALALAALAVGLLLALALLVPNVWLRMGAYYGLLGPLALGMLRLDWRRLLAPSPRRLVGGAAAAVLFYLLGWGGFHLLAAAFPALAAETATLYAWTDQAPARTLVPLLVAAIVVGEEIVWRGAITLPLAARLGPAIGGLLGALLFGAAHLLFASPLLILAAVALGFAWSWLALVTRSLVPPLVCHLLWDLAVLLWLPY